MPIYEYRCLKCGKRVEKIQKFSDPPLKTHPGCGGKVERLLSSPAIQFKGSGFYITDYARKPAPTEGSESKPASAGSKPAEASSASAGGASGGAESSESKPAPAGRKKGR